MKNYASAFLTYPGEENYTLTKISPEAEAKIANFHFQLANNSLKRFIADRKPA